MVNAVGNLPVFADMTSGLDKGSRRKIFRIAVLTGAGIVVSFAFFGSLMLKNVFEPDTDSFKIAGGILFFIWRGFWKGLLGVSSFSSSPVSSISLSAPRRWPSSSMGFGHIFLEAAPHAFKYFAESLFVRDYLLDVPC